MIQIEKYGNKHNKTIEILFTFIGNNAYNK